MSSVWGELVDTVDCGDEVASWLTEFLQGDAQPGVRLVYFPSAKPSRSVRPKNKWFKCTERDVVGEPSDLDPHHVTVKSVKVCYYERPIS